MEKQKYECYLKVKSYDSSPSQLFLNMLAMNWSQYSRRVTIQIKGVLIRQQLQ